MDTCDGGYDSHEWVAFTNDMGCPLCAMREYKDNIIEASEQDVKDLQSELAGAIAERDELDEKLSEYAGIDESIKKMIEGKGL